MKLQPSTFVYERLDYKFFKHYLFCRYAREKLIERRPKPTKEQVKQEKEEKDSYQLYEEPGTAAKPLGTWKTIEE